MSDQLDTGALRRSRREAFAHAVRDMTEHRVDVGSTNVEVIVAEPSPTQATTLNDLGEIVRAYGMEFGSGVVTDEGTTMLTFVERAEK